MGGGASASQGRMVAAAHCRASRRVALLGQRVDARSRAAGAAETTAKRLGAAGARTAALVLAMFARTAREQLQRFGSQRQWWCRECFKAYYAERRAHHRRRNNALEARRVREAQDFVLAFLRAHPCLDCGERDTVVLELDHVGPKRAEVSTLVRRGVLEPVLLAEMARCEIVCANCHRRRTAKRQGWWRIDRRQDGGWRSKRQERNEVRCVNCHRRRTARELGAFRAQVEYPQRESNSRYEIENLAC